MVDSEENGEALPAAASAPAVDDPSKSLDGRTVFETSHHRSAKKIQQCARAYVAFTKLYARANLLIEKIIEPVQTKQYGRPIYYYYHTVLQRSRWDKPTYLGSLDIVKTAPTYAIEQAAIMVQGVWRRRQGWKRVMAAMCSVWSKTVDPSTGASYYYNYVTGEAKWEKPLIFGSKDVEDFTDMTEAILAKEREQAEKEARIKEREERKAKIRESKEKKGSARVGEAEHEENVNNANKDSNQDPGEANSNEGNLDTVSAIVDNNADSASEDESEEESADESDDDDDDDSDDDDDAPLPREWPRSKSQLIVDKVEDVIYRRKQKRSYWPLLRSAVFLGGFERHRKIARIDDGSNESDKMGSAAIDDSNKGKKKKEKKEKKDKKKKDKKADNDDDNVDDDEDAPLPPDAMSVTMNHLNLTLATSRLWEMGTSLTSVDLRHNKIERVSEDISGLVKLRTLQLDHNCLREFPDDWFSSRTCLMEEMKDLRILDLSHNRIPELPISIYFNPELKSLNVSHNLLERLPHAAPGDTTSLSQQDYMDLLKTKGAPVLGVGYVHQLRELDLSFNQLADIPATIEECAELRVLKLTNNKLTSAPATSLESLEELRVLELSGNQIEELPAEGGLASLPNLNELGLAHNTKLSLLPSFESLKALQTLNLSHCNFSNVPLLAEALQGLAALTSLDVSFNKLVRLPLLGVSAAAAAAEANKGAKKSGSSNRKKKAGKSGSGKGGDSVPLGFPMLQYLDCSSNELEELGTALPPQLTYLDLSHNKLLELPDAQLDLCRRLRILKCSHNRLGAVPGAMGHCYKLELVDFSHNNISAQIPGSAVRLLFGLAELNLSHNQLSELPPELAKPPALRILDVSHNVLTSFPDPPLNQPSGSGSNGGEVMSAAKAKMLGPSVAETEAALCWPALMHLNLAYNELVELPESLPKHATKLRELYLEHNQLVVLPRQSLLSGLTNLRKVSVRHNQLGRAPPFMLKSMPGLKFVDLSSNPFNGFPGHPLTEGASSALALTEAGANDDVLPPELEASLNENDDVDVDTAGNGTSTPSAPSAASAATGTAVVVRVGSGGDGDDNKGDGLPAPLPPKLTSEARAAAAAVKAQLKAAREAKAAAEVAAEAAVMRSAMSTSALSVSRAALAWQNLGKRMDELELEQHRRDEEQEQHRLMETAAAATATAGGMPALSTGGGAGAASLESSSAGGGFGEVDSYGGHAAANAAPKKNKRPTLEHFGGEMLSVRHGLASLALARTLRIRRQGVLDRAAARGIVKGSPEWEVLQLKRSAAAALKEAAMFAADLHAAELAPQASGGRTQFSRKSDRGWPWRGSYHRAEGAIYRRPYRGDDDDDHHLEDGGEENEGLGLGDGSISEGSTLTEGNVDNGGGFASDKALRENRRPPLLPLPPPPSQDLERADTDSLELTAGVVAVPTKDEEEEKERVENEDDGEEKEEVDDEEEESTKEGAGTRKGELTIAEIKTAKGLELQQRAELEAAVRSLDVGGEQIGAAHGARGSGVEVFYGRAVARMALGTPGLAVPDVEAVLKLRPLHLPSLVARAEIREANGQYRQARGDCLKGLRVCRSLPATVAGVLEGEAALEATLEQVELGRKACAKAGIDSADVEREWFVTPEGIAKRRPTELRNLFTEGRSMKRAWIEGHTRRNWLALETENSRVAAVAKERESATRKAERSREFVAKVRNQRLLERALEKARLEEAKEAAAVAQAARVLAEERASEARERRTMAQEEEFTRALLVKEAEPSPEAAVEEKREAELAADEEDMDDLLKGRGGRRKKKK